MSKLAPFHGRRLGGLRRWLPAALAVAPFVLPTISAAAPRAKGDSAVRFPRKAGGVRTRGPSKRSPRAAKTTEKAKPELTGDAWARAKVVTSARVTQDLIKTAQRLIEAVEPEDKEYPDYVFRLANLYLDQRQLLEMESGEQYARIFALKEAGKKQEAAQARAQQKRQQNAARKASVAAVRQLHKLVNDPRQAGYKRLDEGLYYYATELGALGKDAEMQDAYVRLLREFPTSPFVPQVYLSFADHKYNGGDIAAALTLYQKIVDGFSGSPVYAYALYKIGWCHLNPVGTATPDYSRSLDAFTAAINATHEGHAGSEANGAQLRREARRDMVKAYVHAARPSKAWQFFGTVGKDPAGAGPGHDMQRKMMELLAEAYFGEGMYVESSATYKRLQRELSEDAATCQWQARVVENALATDDTAIQWKETRALAMRWQAFESAKHPKNDKKRCRRDTIDALVRRGTTWHDEASKTQRDETWALAGEAYSTFLAHFPKHRDAYEMNYYLAEVKWAQAERLYEAPDRKRQDEGRALFCESADAFVETLARNPKGKFTKEAAYAQMLGWKNCTEYRAGGAKAQRCTVQSDGTCVYRTTHNRRVQANETDTIDASARFPETPYTEKEAHMLAAYKRYQKYVTAGDDPELPKILFHRATLMVEHHRFDEALPVLRTLVNDFDGSVYSVWAAEMFVDILTIRWADGANTNAQQTARGAGLLELAKRIEKKKLWRHAEAARLRTSTPDVVMAVRWTLAQNLCDAGAAGENHAFIECGDAFYAIYEDFPKHDRGDDLLFSAAVGFEAGFLLGNAIQLRNALLDNHPDSPLYKKTLRIVAENYQAIAYYDQSASKLEHYAAKYKRDDYAATALGNAYLFRSGLGDDVKARDDLDRYEALYRRKDPTKAAEIYWSQGELIGAQSDKLAHAEAYISRYGKKGGVDRLAVAHATAGQIQWRQSCDKKLLADTCVTLKRKRAMVGEKPRAQAEALRRAAKAGIAKRCGTATRGVLVVHKRDAKLVQRAQAHFDKAMALADKAPSIPEGETARNKAFADAWAMSMVYRADAQYEAYLKVEMPKDLDFYVEEWKKDSGVARWERQHAAQVKQRDASVAEFGTFMADKRKLGDALLTAYGKVTKVGSPGWTLAAAARSAIVWQNFADQLYRAEVPKDVKTQDQYDAYCFQLSDYAEPMEKMALGAFEYCLDRSTKFQYFNEFSRMCEEELQQREPSRFPATNELYGTSRYTDARMDVAGVQTTLQAARVEPKR